MISSKRKIIYGIFLNTLLFLFLMISIQNSNKKNKVNFIFNETIGLPTSFIIGVSFITGSLMGSILPFGNNLKNGE